MPEKRKVFFTCSDRDIKAAALKLTHERMKEMDQKREITFGKFGEILRQEQAKVRQLAENDVRQGVCRSLTFEELKEATNNIDKKPLQK
ncbi:MAG: hypothetical protein AAC990_04170 [Dehalococcoides mccartyi]|uniref:hypothetical protein n=1 Tax=Dehalococcoides mccartyi TaxID=61435 RepID=UPI0030F755DD